MAFAFVRGRFYLFLFFFFLSLDDSVAVVLSKWFGLFYQIDRLQIQTRESEYGSLDGSGLTHSRVVLAPANQNAAMSHMQRSMLKTVEGGKNSKHEISFLSHPSSLSDTMASNNPSTRAATVIPQFVCQVCGNFLQQDTSLDTIDDQIMKPIGKIHVHRVLSHIDSNVSSSLRCKSLWWLLQWTTARQRMSRWTLCLECLLFFSSRMELSSFEKHSVESDCKLHSFFAWGALFVLRCYLSIDIDHRAVWIVPMALRSLPMIWTKTRSKRPCGNTETISTWA